MTYTCRTEKEVANAIKQNADVIEIIGDAKNGVIRIKATGKVAWGVCATFLAAAITSYLAAKPAVVAAPPAGEAFAILGTAAATVPAAILGSAIVPAIIIGAAAGGIGALTTLRDKYKIIEESENYIVLKRKGQLYQVNDISAHREKPTSAQGKQKDIDAAVSNLVNQMKAGGDQTISLDDIMQSIYGNNQESGRESLVKHLGDEIVISHSWDDVENVHELGEDELWDGELSGSIYRVGCYLIRDTQRLYADTQDEMYTDRVPAGREKVTRYKECQSKQNAPIHIEGIRLVREISACYAPSGAIATSQDDWKYVCLATAANNPGSWYEEVDFMGTVKDDITVPDDQVALFVRKTYVGDSFRVMDWYRLRPDGSVSEYDEHPFAPESLEKSWRDPE